MIAHNLTIAFRNMWKYRTQTLISIIGLAVGFTCFTLATLWIRYEMTFDNFHKNAKNMYVVYAPYIFGNTAEYRRADIYPLATYLKETFPEIIDAAPLGLPYPGRKVTVEDIEYPAMFIRADSSFFRMFDVKILEGSWDFLIPDSRKVAITREKARQLFGNEHPVGKTINNGRIEICAVVSQIPKQSNYTFDFIEPVYSYAMDPTRNWFNSSGDNTIIKLMPETNIEVFKKKLYEHEIVSAGIVIVKKFIIKPLTKIRYVDPYVFREVKFQHIVIFAVSGILVILCSLFNYLTLFVSRFRIRQKELALRIVCGASGGSLLTMLSVEFILTLLLAVIFGSMLTQWLYKPFLVLSEIQMDLPEIYRESLLYIVGIIIVSLLLFWLILLIFRKRSLNVSINRNNKNLSRKISVIVQLVISIVFAFSTIVILKQMYFLRHTDELGFSFQNGGAVRIGIPTIDGGILANHLKRVPEITEAINASETGSLLPVMMRERSASIVDSWDNKPDNAKDIDLVIEPVSPEYAAFYNLRLLTGEMLTDADPDSLVLLNETAVKAFGWHEPVGKKFNNKFTVKGVIKNIYNFTPTGLVNPVCYSKPRNIIMRASGALVLFKYQEGMWKSCKEKIEQSIKKEYNVEYSPNIINFAEEYNKFLKSENSLIKLLSFVSAICILICVFGFVSLVSLTCEERRKEIAIRKINGATMNDIISIFAKEYFFLLMIGAVIAFSAGYFIMQRWLENYVKQTSIPAWIYLAIILALALVIVICVGWQVYRASVENPAEVVKGS